MKLRRTFTLLLCTALLIAAVGLSGCFRSLPNEATGTAPAESQSYSMPTAPDMPTVSLPTAPAVTTEIPTVTLPPVSEIPTVPTTVPPVTVPPTLPPASEVPTTAAPQPMPETWTKAQIVQFVTNAVNLTKSYTGPLTVDQQQKFTFNIETISPNIPLVKNFAQSVIDGVLKGSQETLTFNGGYATTSEGETIPILLPKRQAFVLPEAGVASAAAHQSGSNVIVDLTLVPEYGTLSSFPPYNSGSIGYLNADSLDISLFTIEKFDVSYSGSTIRFVIGANGYVLSADYNTPVVIDASGKVALVSGGFKSSGASTESWVLHW